MIKIALVVALSAFVVYGVIPSGTPETASMQQPQRANKGDRLPVRPSNTACGDVVWPHYRDECVRRPPPSNQAPTRGSLQSIAFQAIKRIGSLQLELNQSGSEHSVSIGAQN